MITSIIKIGFVGFLSITSINRFNKKNTSHLENGLGTVYRIELPTNQPQSTFREFVIVSDTTKKSKAYNDSIKNVLQKKLEMKPNKKSYQVTPY